MVHMLLKAELSFHKFHTGQDSYVNIEGFNIIIYFGVNGIIGVEECILIILLF